MNNAINEKEYINQKILFIPDNTKYWFVRAGQGAAYYQDFLINNYVGADTNEMKLAKLYSIPQSLRSASDAVLARYKELFNEHDLKLFYNNKNKNDKNFEKDRIAAITRSTNRANRVFHFIEEMSIGDFVIIPHDNSTKYLIGVIVSDCFDQDIKHIDIRTDEDEKIKEPGYNVSHFEVKRRVYWIKELDQKHFPDKLSWIRTAHQSLFNITENGNDINPYICPLYVYKGTYYMRFGVNTTQKISSLDWLEYQTLIKNIVGKDNLKKIFQKQKVQSPGDIITFCQQSLPLLFIINNVLFGKVDFNYEHINAQFFGILTYFSKSERIARKVKAQKGEIDLHNNQIKLDQAKEIEKIEKKKNQNKLKEEENRAKKLEAESKILDCINNELDKYHEKNEDLQEINKTLDDRNNKNINKVESLCTYKKDEYDTDDILKNIKLSLSNVDKIVNKFELSNENPGESISTETQEDNLS